MIIETIIVVKHLWWLKKNPTQTNIRSINICVNINFLNDGCVLNQPHVFIDELLMRTSLSYFFGQKVFVMCGPTVREG